MKPGDLLGLLGFRNGFEIYEDVLEAMNWFNGRSLTGHPQYDMVKTCKHLFLAMSSCRFSLQPTHLKLTLLNSGETPRLRLRVGQDVKLLDMPNEILLGLARP